MRYALIGCGRIAGRHLTAARAASLEVVAVCDPVLERGRELLRRTGLGESGARIYADHRELLDRERPELAAVAAESGVHARVALDCLDAGAHVIVEKPIALSLSDADEMIRRAGERGLCLVPCHQNRFNPAVMALRARRGTVRQTFPCGADPALEPGRRILQAGGLARALGERRGYPDEPVHPWD